ncbi:MAG: 3-deoxy-7-phosphoheptulonate synthase [Firmicutes bacterium]|nr:3-deoxy-7-phosphoheptulonate synthase [Bacillota bacterium]MDH7495461.1 3-deoxy-7-phosphoheptulonate synthase [Bacillota bacterium]
MIVIMRQSATDDEIHGVMRIAENAHLRVHVSRGEERTVVGLIGDVRRLDPDTIAFLPGVERVVRVLQPFKLASREFIPNRSPVPIAGVLFGGSSEDVPVIAGPCAVEGEDSMIRIARVVAAGGASVLRGGAFKPRTSPYSFQGLGELGLRILAKAREVTGLPVVTEVVSPQDVELVCTYADALQIGSRNMHNYALLHEVGLQRKPVILKRGMMSSVDEWLMAAEYVLSAGNDNVILCERGIRTFETSTRNTLDLSAVAVVKKLSHLPVIVDPSHATGRADMVVPMALAAVACGADGLMVEVHDDPACALSDGPQSVRPEAFADMMRRLGPVAEAIGRRVLAPSRLDTVGACEARD